jgi:hypothetical protein
VFDSIKSLGYLSLNWVYYFASPYSDPDPLVKETRYLQTIQASSELVKKGFILIEPIAMSHHQAQRFGLPTGYDFWKTRDRKFIEISNGVIVLMLDGWKQSKGVQDEIAYARLMHKPIYYLDPTTLNIVNPFHVNLVG